MAGAAKRISPDSIQCDHDPGSVRGARLERRFLRYLDMLKSMAISYQVNRKTSYVANIDTYNGNDLQDIRPLDISEQFKEAGQGQARYDMKDDMN